MPTTIATAGSTYSSPEPTTASEPTGSSKRPSLWKRISTLSVNYVKNVSFDYTTVFKELALEARQKPLKSIFVAGAVIGAYYAYKTNPSQHQLYAYLSDLRQEMVLVPAANRSTKALRELERYTLLGNTNRLVAYDCIFATFIVQKPHSKKCNLYSAQDPNLRQWIWQEFWKNFIDVGAFGKFWNLEHCFIDYDICEEEFLP